MASEDWPFANAWSMHGNKDIVSRYEILERIGEGTFGEVHRARRREDSLIVALKEIHNSESSSREIRALLLLDHPNIIKLYEYFAQGSNMVLVLEYLPYNLSEVIKSGKGELSDGEVKGYMIQILRGLAACHAVSILHRDLKPNNLLISEDRTVKIADFGQARVLSKVDFINRGELCGSDIHKNYVTGSEGHSSHEATTVRDNRDLEFYGDVSVLEGRKGEASGVCFGVGIGRIAAGQGNSSTRATVDKIPPVTDFAASALTDSHNLDRNVSHLGSVSTNVGFSTLADAVKDARNYFTIEEMVRSGTGMDGLGLSGLQRQRIIGAHTEVGAHTEDPGCCGWFPMENAEKHNPAMTGGRNWSSANETMGKDEVLERSVGRDHQVREREDDFSSGDESDVDWKGNYGIRSEDLLDALKKTEEMHKAGISSSSAQKGGDGDFLQKIRRFIRKRTKRLNTEGGRIAGGPVHSRIERISDGGGVGRTLKEAAKRDGDHTLHVHRSPAGSRKIPSTERNSVNVKSTHMASNSVASSQGQEVYSQAQIRKGVRNFLGKERESLKVESTNDDGSTLDGMDDVSAASRLNDAHTAQLSLVEEADCLTVPKKPEDEVMDGEEEDGDLRTESGRKLYGGLQVEKVERKRTVVVNGPLREMAYARVQEVGMTATVDQLDFKDNFPTVDERQVMSEVENSGGQMSAMDLEESKGHRNTLTTRDSQEGCTAFPGPSSEEVLDASKLAIPNTWEVGWKDVDGLAESVNGKWGGSTGEAIPGSRDVCQSWTQMEGYNSTLSDAEAEGTRWYGAPEFQYSYMDSKGTDQPAGGRVNDEAYGRATGSEEEWEEGSEDGSAYHKSRGDYSQESFGRGGNSDSGHGSDFTTMVGTRWYKAPELLYGATKYGTGIDIWAVGCIFGELLWGKPLFPGLNDIDQLSRVVRILGSPNEKIWRGISLLPDFNKICFVDERSPLSLRNYLPHISEAALDFLQKLLTYDPVLRLSAENALEDEFFFKQPLPFPCNELPLPTREESEASDEDWGNWKDPGSPFSDFEILG